MMVLPEVQEIFLKYKSQEEKIDSILCSRKFPYESSGNPSFENGNVQLTLSLQQAQQRNRELMKELETVKGNLRSKAIFSPSELQWEKVSKEYASIKSLPITTWRCHLPVFVKTWAPTKTRGHSKRAIMKNGYTNVIRKKLSPNRRWRYLQDIFTTLLDAQWRWTLQFLALCFFGCWLAFSLIWWLIAFVHGDLHEDHLPIKQPETGWTPCVLNIHGFHSCFLYSLETQHTTGYGLRAITEECPEAIFVLCFQCIIGMMIDSFTVGIVFAKMVRSKMATYTIQFSRNAVVSRRDDKLCLMFRVGDIRRSNLVGVTLTGILIKSERTSEDDVLENYQTGLSLKVDDGDNNLVLLWPMTAYHVIDQDSPLFKMSAVDMLREEFEIVVILSATVESTGASAEAKSSYLSNEILWGRNFVSVVSFDAELDSYEVDWSCFDRTASVETPRTSAADQSENLPELNPDKLQNQNRPASEEDFSTARERLVRADQADEEELLLSFINSEASSSVPRIRKPQCTLHNYFRNCEVPQTINENEELVELSLV